MAMLAETRRRKNYTLVPKGKALYEDGDRFGTKMLEKMGWSKGKGLGANEDGEKDFVRIRYKRDNEGFGFEARDDQWTQHEKDFTGLLKNLHGEGEEEAADEGTTTAVGFGFQGTKPSKESMKEKLTGKSLVEMSKISRARVHYQKFARGKDLSRASEKDLANIFGRKVTTEQDNIFKAFQAVNNIPEEKDDKEESEETKEEGVQIVNTGISISDYFKQKMEALKLKRAGGAVSEEVPSKKIKAEEEASNQEENPEETQESEKPKKKKKKDKNKEKDDILEEKPSEKPQKKKKIQEEIEQLPLEIIETEETSEKPKKKKKKSKEEEPVEEEKPKKKKDKKAEEIIEVTEEKTKKKKKKSKEVEKTEEEQPEKPKKKKKKSELDSDQKPTSSDDELSSPPSQVPNPTSTNDKEPTEEKEEEWTEVKSKRNFVKDPTPEPEEQFIDDPKKYKINSYIAERFRNIDMPAFLGSNLSQFKGYGLDEVEQLEVFTRPIDDFKIREFWKKDLIIFDDADMREEFIQIGSHAKSANELLGMSNYRRKVHVARKEKQKIPKLNLGAIKKRRAFTGI
ncbi:PINX1 family protein [Megaselia abdita]